MGTAKSSSSSKVLVLCMATSLLLRGGMICECSPLAAVPARWKSVLQNDEAGLASESNVRAPIQLRPTSTDNRRSQCGRSPERNSLQFRIPQCFYFRVFRHRTSEPTSRLDDTKPPALDQ